MITFRNMPFLKLMVFREVYGVFLLVGGDMISLMVLVGISWVSFWFFLFLGIGFFK